MSEEENKATDNDILYEIDMQLYDEFNDKLAIMNEYLGDFAKNIKNINIDILDNGIIHLWNNYQKAKSIFRVSSCTFDFVDKEVL